MDRISSVGMLVIALATIVVGYSVVWKTQLKKKAINDEKFQIEKEDNALKAVKRIQEISKSQKKLIYIIGIAGIPGSGKTTLSKYIKDKFSNVYYLPMDGYHYTKAQLDTFDDPQNAHNRRGAPFTFDALSFVNDLERLKRKAKENSLFTFPDFDHSVGDPIADAIKIKISQEPIIVIVEGNYLALDEGNWKKIWKKPNRIVDELWYLDVDLKVAQERLVKRHCKAWKWDEDRARDRVMKNDALNMKTIIEKLASKENIDMVLQ